MTECEYDLGYREFFTIQDFLSRFEAEGNITIDKYEKEMEEIFPEDYCKLYFIREFGESISEVRKKLRDHVRECDKCRKRYMSFVGTERMAHRMALKKFKSPDMKKAAEKFKSINPDYLNLIQ